MSKFIQDASNPEFQKVLEQAFQELHSADEGMFTKWRF